MGTKLARETERALVTALRSSLRGEVIDREHPGYDAARRVWNGLIDRHPAVMARCADTADVVATVRVAREQRPLVSIRGGGHQVAGSAVCDDGLVIDLSRMKGVRVDPAARTVRARAGVTWGELDRATQTFALATTGGEVSTTGIAGFTLGGGMGLLMRRHGLACDNLRSIEVVTAEGEVLTASQTQHPDLFWAARGGGRGLGIVTSFEFGLHALGPKSPPPRCSIATTTPDGSCKRSATSLPACPRPWRRSSPSGRCCRTQRFRRRCTGPRSSWWPASTRGRQPRVTRFWPRSVDWRRRSRTSAALCPI